MADPKASPAVYQFCRRALKLGMILWNRFEAHGGENVPTTGGCIVASNHVSFLDPPALGCGVRNRVVRFMARDTLFQPPWFGNVLHRVGVIPISREKGDVGALRKAIQCLKEGSCIGLFPEGTRSPDGTLQPAKGGIGFLIAKAGVPVVPAYIEGTYDAYPRSAKRIRPTKVRITYGKPIMPEEFAALGKDRDAYEKVGSLVMDRIREIRDQVTAKRGWLMLC